MTEKTFLNELKLRHAIIDSLDTQEIRYLPNSAEKRAVWRAIEYNETIFGPIYRFFYALISIVSIYLFVFDVTVTRNQNFIEFNSVQSNNNTVRLIDYRPDVNLLAFHLEIVFVAFWIVELFVRVISAPNFHLSISTMFFWFNRRILVSTGIESL